MRRRLQRLDNEIALNWLNKGITGILSLNDKDGYPYTIPLNYVLIEDSIYFHCALEGKKIDLIRMNSKACFCVVEKDEIIPLTFSTSYGSVICKGDIRLIEETQEKRYVLEQLCENYAKNYPDLAKIEIDSNIDYCAIVGLKIVSIVGKQSKDRIKCSHQ
ncbi:MAG: pyridoxamine 5'-phosphate oxidase family protein [Erysipelotrichaceae bacterium]